MDDAWPWLASLPPPLGEGGPETPPPPPPWSLPLAVSTDGASIVLQADTSTTAAAASASPAGNIDDVDDDSEPARHVAFSVAINGAGGEARALWASERFAASSPVPPRVQLLVQLLNEVLALSHPFVPRLGGGDDDASEAKVDAETVSAAAVVGVGSGGADRDPSAAPAAASFFFSLALLLRLFWLCALDAPADAGYVLFRDLGAEIERGLGECRPALAVFLHSVGPDVEVRFMRSLGYMLAKWCLLREIQAAAAAAGAGLSAAAAAPRRRRRRALPAACPLYATEVHGLWVLKGYAPVLAMPRVDVVTGTGPIAASPDEAPEEPALRYGLAHQQLEAVAQLEYAVRVRDRRFVTVSVRVDNVRVRIARLAFRKDNDGEEEGAAAAAGAMDGESHFPSRIRVWVGPRFGASYATGPSLGRSTGNPERDVEMTRTVKGAFAGGGTKPANVFKAKMRSSARTRNRSWRWEQEAEGSAGVLEGVLYDPVTGTEVSAWRPAGSGTGANGVMRRRYGGPGRAFSKMRGLVVAGDELPEEMTWRVGREAEGSTLRWRLGLKAWVSYLPNEVRSRHLETRCVEWAHEVDLPLVAVDGDES